MESLNHDPNWLKKISIDIDQFLIDREYIYFFMQMFIQRRKDDGSTSSFQKLIITYLYCFETLALSQFKAYIEIETMTHCFVCCNFQNTILVWSSEGKERFYFILHMLIIHTVFRKLSKKNVYDLLFKYLNPFDIGKPCIIIERR